MRVSDVIITNPPFSDGKPAELVNLALHYGKKFIILAPQTMVTNKSMFKPLMNKQLWYGVSIHGGDVEFEVPSWYENRTASIRTDEHGRKFVRVTAIRWFTNINHGKWQTVSMHTFQENKKLMHGKAVEKVYGHHYDNLPQAIEVPWSKAVPSDYDGLFGVPVSWLDYYNPDKFEIRTIRKGNDGKDLRIDGKDAFCRLIVERM